jgi:hypothetical protein
MLEISTTQQAQRMGTPVRRRNGDRVYLFGEHRRQLKTVRKILMKLSQHYGLPMATFADFIGIERINTTNDELIDCLSNVPDPYAEVDLRAAMVASTRDFRICERVRAQDPTIEQLLTVSGNSEDWYNFWRVRSSKSWTPERMAKDAELQKLKAENRERLERRGANGHAN